MKNTPHSILMLSMIARATPNMIDHFRDRNEFDLSKKNSVRGTKPIRQNSEYPDLLKFNTHGNAQNNVAANAPVILLNNSSPIKYVPMIPGIKKNILTISSRLLLTPKKE
jgi:hypothetical protein